MTAADVDGDGHVDLVTANSFRTVSVLRNLGDGTFAARVDVRGGERSYSVTAADVDGDGHVDLVTANTWLRHRFGPAEPGRRHVRGPGDYAVGNGPRSVTAADVDGDGARGSGHGEPLLPTPFRSYGTWATARSPPRSTYAVGAVLRA